MIDSWRTLIMYFHQNLVGSFSNLHFINNFIGFPETFVEIIIWESYIKILVYAFWQQGLHDCSIKQGMGVSSSCWQPDIGYCLFVCLSVCLSVTCMRCAFTWLLWLDFIRTDLTKVLLNLQFKLSSEERVKCAGYYVTLATNLRVFPFWVG